MRKNFKFTVGGFIFRVKITKKRGRILLPFLPEVKTILHARSGSKVSRAFRIILERVNIKSFLGGNIAFFVLFSEVLNPAVSVAGEPEITNISVLEQPLPANVKFQYPLTHVTVNQGYSFFHPALDLKGETGDLVRPISSGQIVRVEYSRFGYGNSIVVDHKNGLVSRYAHLSKINSEIGEEVHTETVIGEVGSTGRSTGPHLHFEIHKNGKPINPKTILP